jgi:glycosyltransferase involved in cell wall biosynthesis
MRVLFVCNHFPPDYTGGAEVSLYHTCRGLMADGSACRVLHINNRRTSTDQEWHDVDGIPVHRIQFATRWPWQEVVDRRIVAAVRREVQDFHPDLVHIHNVSGSSLAPYVACNQESIPTVGSLHDYWLLCPNNLLYREDGTTCDPAEYSEGCGRCLRRYDYWADVPARRSLFARLTRDARLFISPSQALIAEHVAAGYSPARFRLVQHGIEDRPIPTEGISQEVAGACKAAQTRPMLLFAGGGVEIKGAKTLLRALPLLHDAVQDALIVIAGGGDAATLQAFRRAGSHVLILGKVPFLQMRALYAAADLVLFPSVCLDNSPMVIYEAFQTGTPVVGAAIGGVPELVRPGERGMLFEPDDAEGLAQRVAQHFAKTADERRRMRHNCRRYAHDCLSLSRHVSAMRRVYDEALQ